MEPSVLVAYVTRSGSTGEVAEAVAKTMNEAGVRAEAKPMTEIESIADGQPLILGTALYVGHLPKEFHQFVDRFRLQLSQVRPWVFVLGPTENDPKHFSAAEEQARKELSKHPWLYPADMLVLGGKWDPQTVKVSFPFSLVLKFPGNPLSKVPASDIRDWEWIRTWAKAIADRLNAAA
jgi:menaquinone-dependent protoporphyrinogen oxidase